MSSRAKRAKSWAETHENIAKARRFAERYGIDDAHPNEYMMPPPDQAEWDDLLKQIK